MIVFEQFANHGRDVVGGGGGADSLQIAAGAECAALAFNHEHADVVVGLDLRTELFELLCNRKIDGVEGTGPVERDRGDRAFDPELSRIVGKGHSGVIGRRHLNLKRSRCEKVAGHLNNRREEVTIPTEGCKMRDILPHGEEALLRRLDPWGHNVPHPSRRGEDAAPQDEDNQAEMRKDDRREWHGERPNDIAAEQHAARARHLAASHPAGLTVWRREQS